MIRMKLHITLALILVFTISSFGSSKTKETKYRQVEDNLLVGMNADNTGLQMSCSYFLGEMKSSRAVNSLLKILKSGETEEERIIAALSLSKIQSEQGLFAVKQRIKFDNSERVQRLCQIFYNSNLIGN